MRRRQTLQVQLPFVGYDPHEYAGLGIEYFVAAVQVGDGYLCVYYRLGVDHVIVQAIKQDAFPTRYSFAPSLDIKTQVSLIKAKALRFGASLEAIQLLGTLTPLTKVEEATMAAANTKLAKPAGPDKDALKAAAKTAPVDTKKAATTEKPKHKGAENLAAARAAKAAITGPDNRKIKVLTEKKTNPYREGSKAYATFELFKTSGTVQEVKDAATGDHDLGYLRYASRDGHISIG